MPLPPDIISVSLFLCERTLQEADGTLSAIRIIDVIWVPSIPPEGSDEKLPVIKMFGCAIIKGRPGTSVNDHSFEFRINTDKPEEEGLILGPPVKLASPKLLPGVENFPTGGLINLEIHAAVKSYGTRYICLLIDGEEASRTPFTVSPPVSQQQDN